MEQQLTGAIKKYQKKALRITDRNAAMPHATAMTVMVKLRRKLFVSNNFRFEEEQEGALNSYPHCISRKI